MGDTSLLGGSPAATLTRSYDSTSGRIERLSAAGRGTFLGQPDLDLTLSVDGLGRVSSQTLSTLGATPEPRSFSYDGLGRLVEAFGR